MPQKLGPDAVERAMQTVRRREFLPEEVKDLAAADSALPLGYGQTNSQPRTVARMLHLLGVQPGHSVLDLGAGTGWTTALLAHLVGPAGQVIGVELVPELAQRAAETLARFDLPQAAVREARPGILGSPDLAPFDRILVSADAEVLHHELTEQLAQTGVMVIPVRSEMLRVQKKQDEVCITQHGPYSFVPLRLNRAPPMLNS